jgi:ABC-type antimicrobial peptide transport system permease subunit
VPLPSMIVLVVVGAVLGEVAALLPAYRAARLEVIAAIAED